jgi:hypothetical protein
MSIECDEELNLHMMESGNCVIARKGIIDPGDTGSFPEEALACLAEHSCEYLGDQLAFSLISDEHRRVVTDLLLKIARSSRFSGKHSLLEVNNIADYFTNWSLIKLFSPPSFVTEVSSSKSSLSFFCGKCRNLIITQNEVESPHYHGGHGPAFLAHRVFNCHHSPDEAYETQFTTGVYKVCEVTCLQCHTRVGKKYIEARDPANFFKVGKILLEQTLLTMPKCCNNRKLNAFPPEHYYCSREPGVSHFCSVCLSEVRGNIASAVLDMTNNLEPSLTMKLYSLLQTERQVFTSSGAQSIDDCSPVSSCLSTPHSSISRRFGDAISRFVRKSFSPTSSLSPRSDSCDAQAVVGDTFVPRDSGPLKGRLDDEQAMVLAHCVGERIGLLNESQNWILSTKFVGDVVAAASRQSMLVTQTGSIGVNLNRSVVIEALVSQCGPITFPSITLLLSRLANMDDRRSVLNGALKNESASLSEPELEALRQISGSGSSHGSSGRWSSSFTAGNAGFSSSHR